MAVIEPHRQEGHELSIREMLSCTVRSLVDRPNDVRVAVVSSPQGSAFQIEAHVTDIIRLMGVDGETALALQIIVSASGTKVGRQFNVDILRWSGTRSEASRMLSQAV